MWTVFQADERLGLSSVFVKTSCVCVCNISKHNYVEVAPAGIIHGPSIHTVCTYPNFYRVDHHPNSVNVFFYSFLSVRFTLYASDD